ENIQSAFRALDDEDCVIGPARDGGYYLIGLCRAGTASSATFPASLFQGIDWGGDKVFEQTMSAAAGLGVKTLEMLEDVDIPEDIPPRISVVIPTLNEEKYLFQAVEKVKDAFNVEIIIVDGGSDDSTRTIFPDALECNKGRAAQQNLGAASATGGILLFLHADTLLPERWDWIVREALTDPSVALGAFSFKIREQIRGLKFIEDTTNWRSKVGGLPYGDQGLFMRREIFDRAGGFPDMPIMEDYAFARSLRKFGQIITRPEKAITSGRRWQEYGVFKVTVINKLMIIGYHLGISPKQLARFYRRR
ncbi:MAG: TIGR04283 family arsenosugar biosynthesis glycosyltransferase, partial [Kiritimatiellaceae bacterium]|nr:TIGR04283 family arsenosugar biosynthesis glycosyltransferase [Kiritimatiellaceae bacterium]